MIGLAATGGVFHFLLFETKEVGLFTLQNGDNTGGFMMWGFLNFMFPARGPFSAEHRKGPFTFTARFVILDQSKGGTRNAEPLCQRGVREDAQHHRDAKMT